MVDFKVVGRTENLETGWKLMEKSGLGLDPPAPLGDYLGCGQFPIHIEPLEAQRRLQHIHPLLEGTIDMTTAITGRPVKALRYNMFGFFKLCVELYLDLANVPESVFKKVSTPSIDDH